MNLYQHRQQVFQELLLPRGYNQDKKITDDNGPKKFVLVDETTKQETIVGRIICPIYYRN
jgi:alpha,alpha-trehalase